MKTFLTNVILIGGFVFLIICVVGAENQKQDSVVVAQFRDGQITLQDIQDVIDTLPDTKRFVPSDLTELEWKSQIIQDLVARQYLAKEALQLSLNTSEQFINLMDRKINDLSMKALFEDEVENNLTVTDGEVKKFYDDHSTLFHMPALVTGRHIFFDLTQAGTPEEKEKVRVRAEEVLKKAQRGDDFSTLANTYSDSQVPDKSRLIGPFAINNPLINITILTTLYSLEPGQVSHLAKTHFGYEILKLERKIPAWTISLPVAKKEIENILISQKKEERTLDFQENLLKKYKAHVYPENFDGSSTSVLLDMTWKQSTTDSSETTYKITLGEFAQKNDISKIPKDQRENIMKRIAYMQAIFFEMDMRDYPRQPKIARQVEEIRDTQLAQLAIEHELSEMSTKLQVSDAEIRNFYKTDSPAQQKFSMIHDEIKIRSIAIALDSTVPVNDPIERMFAMDRLRKRADEAYAQLIAGRNFADVAREFTTDTADPTGKESDYFDADSYPQIPFDFEKLRTGQVSQPIEGANGFLIVKIVGRRNQPLQSLKDRKDWIEKFLKQNKLDKAREDILSAAVRKEDMRINTTLLEKDRFAEIREKYHQNAKN